MAALMTIDQDIFKGIYSPVRAIVTDERSLTADYLDTFLETSSSMTLGISAAYSKKGELSWVALATDNLALIIQLTLDNSPKRRLRRALETRILCNLQYRKLVFDAERLVTALYLDHGYRINNTVDIESLTPKKASRGSLATLQSSLGGQQYLNMKGVISAFQQSHQKEHLRNQSLALRAWSSCIVALLCNTAAFLPAACTIDTLTMSPAVCYMLSMCIPSV